MERSIPCPSMSILRCWMGNGCSPGSQTSAVIISDRQPGTRLLRQQRNRSNAHANQQAHAVGHGKNNRILIEFAASRKQPHPA